MRLYDRVYGLIRAVGNPTFSAKRFYELARRAPGPWFASLRGCVVSTKVFMCVLLANAAAPLVGVALYILVRGF